MNLWIELKQRKLNFILLLIACGLDQDMGPCRASIQRFFYDKSSKSCKEFSYGGCAGNENNFETQA